MQNRECKIHSAFCILGFLFCIISCHLVTLSSSALAQTFHQPGSLPDRIVLTWRKDPARSQSVTWRTDPGAAKGFAEIAPAEAGPNFVTRARWVEAINTRFTSNLGEAIYHTAHFEDL